MNIKQFKLLKQLLGLEDSQTRRDGEREYPSLIGKNANEIRGIAEILVNTGNVIDNVSDVLLALQAAQVSKQKEVAAAIQRSDNFLKKASVHPLTGLFNKESFNEFLRHEIMQVHKGNTSSIALMFADLDGFKAFNDSQGHAAGDNLLSTLGRRLKAVLKRKGDTVSHWGGDEFAVIGAGVTKKKVETFAKKVLDVMADVDPSLRTIVSGSVGVITTDNLYKTWQGLTESIAKPDEQKVLNAVSFLEGNTPAGKFQDALDTTVKTVFEIADLKMYDVKVENKLKRTPANDIGVRDNDVPKQGKS